MVLEDRLQHWVYLNYTFKFIKREIHYDLVYFLQKKIGCIKCWHYDYCVAFDGNLFDKRCQHDGYEDPISDMNIKNIISEIDGWKR